MEQICQFSGTFFKDCNAYFSILASFWVFLKYNGELFVNPFIMPFFFCIVKLLKKSKKNSISIRYLISNLKKGCSPASPQKTLSIPPPLPRYTFYQKHIISGNKSSYSITIFNYSRIHASDFSKYSLQVANTNLCHYNIQRA